MTEKQAWNEPKRQKSDPNLHQTSLKCGVIYSRGGGLGTSLT